MIRIKTLLLIIPAFAALAFPSRAAEENMLRSGLFFRSAEVNKDARTGLDLTPDKALAMRNGFTLSFDIRLRYSIQNFGYVFRIIGNDSLNIDLLSNLTPEVNEQPFSLVLKNRALIQYSFDETEMAAPDEWMKVRLRLDTKKETVELSINNTVKTTTYPLRSLRSFRIFFGGNTHSSFSTTDIAPMLVKDICISDESGRPSRRWTLSKHTPDNGALDECEGSKAIAVNPVWEADRHVQWHNLTTFSLTGGSYQTAFDPAHNRFFFVDGRRILSFDTGSLHLDTIIATGGVPYMSQQNQVLYDAGRDALISYNIESDRQSVLPVAFPAWSNGDSVPNSPRYWHHNRVYIPADSSIHIFGGYGFHTYLSMLHRYDFSFGKWERQDMSNHIAPRYLAAMGRLDDERLLVFGGFGNKSGKQEESPHNFYDLYTIRTDGSGVHKQWELSGVQEQFTNSNSLYADSRRSKFYALAYPNKRYATSIRLHEYEIERPSYRPVGDEIAYTFNDIESYCDLFANADTTELYALVLHSSGSRTEVAIYSIACPPLSPEDVFQKENERGAAAYIFLVGIIAIAAIAAACLRLRNRKKVNPAPCPAPPPQEEIIPEAIEAPEDEKTPTERCPAIYLLGNLRILNSDGRDMATHMAPVVTQLFLLIWTSTVRNGKGITSKEIQKNLWDDKDDSSARNARNVYINRLRLALKDFPELKVVQIDNHWTITVDSAAVFCDYAEVLSIIKALQKHFRKDALAHLLDMAHNGRLLPDQPVIDWLEPLQSDYTATLIERLLSIAAIDEVKTDLAILHRIADVILMHDNIDEDAIRLKCYSLFHAGRRKQALEAYNKYLSSYRQLLASDFKVSFQELIGK
jgi:DNA-binding SARP family transcriptional activator